jgi:hypothetical protein
MANAMMDNEARDNRVQELRTALEDECGSFGIVTWGDAGTPIQRHASTIITRSSTLKVND